MVIYLYFQIFFSLTIIVKPSQMAEFIELPALCKQEIQSCSEQITKVNLFTAWYYVFSIYFEDLRYYNAELQI